MKTIAFIPVRGGSKSIPLKNIKNLAGEPLLTWSLRAACESKNITEVVIATDHEEIANCAKSLNHPKITIYSRQSENAQDTSSTESVMLEYLATRKLSPKDRLVLIQATNPFIKADDLDQGIEKLKKEKSDSLLSVVLTKRFFWNAKAKPLNYDFKKRPRRQDFEGMMMENGAFYITSVGGLLKSKNRLNGKISLYEMPEYSGFEIDEQDDWVICESLMDRHGYKVLRDFSKVKLFLTDLDGVLTDAGMYYSENGDELKKFNTLDGMGLQLLKKAGIPVGIVTAENRQLNQRRAEKLGLDILRQGVKDKITVVKEICREHGLDLSEVAYVGDDINDFEVLSSVGFPACPASAVKKIRTISGIFKLSKSGGQGVIREYADHILSDKNI